MENAEAVSEMTGIPLAGVSAAGELINKVDTKYPKIKLDLNLTLPWEL